MIQEITRPSTRRSASAAPDVAAMPRAAAAPRSQTAGFARIARAGQVALGLLWLIDGILQFQPYMFGKTFVTGVLLPNATGQPGVIAAPITWIAHLIEPHVVLFNGFAATLQVLIGLGLLCRRTVKPALAVSFMWALGIWFTGEGLGGFFNDTASPLTGAPGAALLYVIAGLMVWPHGPLGRFGVRGRELGLLGVRGARAVIAVLWGGFALLWLLPANSSSSAVHDAIAAAPAGAGWLTNLLDGVARATAGHGTTIALVFAALSAAIAVAVARGWHTRAFLALSIVIAVAFWIFGQAFGGVLTGQATDVNTGPLLILLSALMIAACRLVPTANSES